MGKWEVPGLGCHILRHLCCIKHFSGIHQSWCCSREGRIAENVEVCPLGHCLYIYRFVPVTVETMWCFRPIIFTFCEKPRPLPLVCHCRGTKVIAIPHTEVARGSAKWQCSHSAGYNRATRRS